MQAHAPDRAAWDRRWRGAALGALLGVAVMAGGCAPEPVEPPTVAIGRDERAEVEAYLEAVSELNRGARDQRNRIRWWVAEVPAALWEDRSGGVRSKADDAKRFGQDMGEWRTAAEAIRPVPPKAEAAHAAYLASFTASSEMLEVYRRVLDAAVEARREGRPPPDRTTTEAAFAEARARADQATTHATDLLGQLLRGYDAGQPKS